MTDPDHLLANVNRMAQRLAEIERTPEQKAQAVIANLQQLIIMEEHTIKRLDEDMPVENARKANWMDRHNVIIDAYKQTIALIKSEFSLT